MVVVDPQGQCLAVNDAMGVMLGYSAAEIQALTLTALTHPDDRENDANLLATLNRGVVQALQFQSGTCTVRPDRPGAG